jgi:flap endonuclease-1
VGVDLSALVNPHRRTVEDFAGKAIAVDAFNTLYQFLAIIRQPDGTPLQDDRGRVTSHLSGIIYRLTGFLALGLRPAFVFDGRPPGRKARTIETRVAGKAIAEREWREALEEGDLPRARTKAMQTSRLSAEMVAQARELLAALGVPCVQAPSEGEAQAAWMAAHGRADAAGSQDYDSLLFGAPVLVKNLAISGRRKLPNKNVFVEVTPEEIRLDEVLGSLAVTREQLVDMGLLMGTDFNEGVRGIGPKKALGLVRKHGTAAAALQALGLEIEGADEVRRIFLEPTVDEAAVPAWGAPDRERVLTILVDEHQFSRQRVEAALGKVEAARDKEGQRSLDQWF